MKQYSLIMILSLLFIPIFFVCMDINDGYEFTLEDKNKEKIKVAYKYIKTSQTFSNLIDDMGKEDYKNPIPLSMFSATTIEKLKNIWPLFVEMKSQELLQELYTISIVDLFSLLDLSNYLDIRQNNQELFTVVFSVLIDRLRKPTTIAELTQIKPNTKIRKEILRQLLLPLLLEIKTVTPFNIKEYEFPTLTLSPSGMYIRIIAEPKFYGGEAPVELWNLLTKKQIKFPSILDGYENFLWAPNETFLLVADPDRLRTFSYDSEWNDIHEIGYQQLNYLIRNVTISPDSTEIAAIVDNAQNKNSHIVVFDNNLQEKNKSSAFSGIAGYSWAADGRIALIEVQVIEDKHFKWDNEYVYNAIILNKELNKNLATFKIKKNIKFTPGGGSGGYMTSAWSPNGFYIATCIAGDNDSFLQIFDTTANKELLEIPIKYPIDYISWSNDNQFLITNVGIFDVFNEKWISNQGFGDFCPKEWKGTSSTKGILQINFTENFNDFKDLTIAEAVTAFKKWKNVPLSKEENNIYDTMLKKHQSLVKYFSPTIQQTAETLFSLDKFPILKKNNSELINTLKNLTKSLNMLSAFL